LRLYEYEGKALLARHGLQVPRGALWPDTPDVAGPLVVKAQVLAGGRGRQGGIRFVADRESLPNQVRALMGSHLGEHRVERVYVEERLEIEREMYLAILIDRDRRAPLLLASPRGGVDVEEVAEGEMVQLPIDPLLGLRPFALRHLAGRLGLSGEAARQAAAAIQGLYEAFKAAEAELVEVNPLVLTRDGRLIAADAKVVLDDEAAFRHPERPREPREGTSFERGCAAQGSVGVEMAGDVAIVVSGAGLMMATVDLLGAAGVTLRAAVDLGGNAFSNPEGLAEVVRLVLGLEPKVIFFNAFFNLAFCDFLARGVADGFQGSGYRGKVLVRLRGRNLPEAQAILTPLGFTLFEDLPEAIDGVIAAARGVG
jgi:succinyl-CoA synthetase beta subunit